MSTTLNGSRIEPIWQRYRKEKILVSGTGRNALVPFMVDPFTKFFLLENSMPINVIACYRSYSLDMTSTVLSFHNAPSILNRNLFIHGYPATSTRNSWVQFNIAITLGRRGSAVVKALCYRKVAGSITEKVIFFNLPNPSGRTRPCGLLSL
jgi:hypothetical protein